jgi:integrase
LNRAPHTGVEANLTKRPLTEEEVKQYLAVFDLRERLISRLAIFEGMRPGEILALRWKVVRKHSLTIEQRVYKRVFDTPKNGKVREIAISEGTADLMKEWRDLAKGPSPEGFVIPAGRSSRLCRRTVFGGERCSPKLEKVGLRWGTFQILRKTNASLSKKYGIDPKVASDQRGHGLGVSMEVYTSSDLEQKRAAVNKLEASVLRKPQSESQVVSTHLA